MQAADYIIQGATFYCGRDLPEDLDFIAIKGNKIAKVGFKGEEKKYISNKTKIINYNKSKLVVPGFHDNHVHLVQSGLLSKYVNLIEAKSETEAAKMVAEFSKQIPDEEWVLGLGYFPMAWTDDSSPTKESLDAMIPNRPVFLLDAEFHTAWMNSMGLTRCGITEDTPDPKGGFLGKNENGHLTGCLYESALCLAGKYALDFNDKVIEELINNYINCAIKNGITSVSDMTPYFTLDMSYKDVFLNMAASGKLKIRINTALDLFGDLEEVLTDMQRTKKEGKGMYRVSYVKQFLDGILNNHTGFLLEEYTDLPGRRGDLMVKQDRLNEAVGSAHKRNIPVRLHARGDGAIRVGLNAIEEAIKVYGKKAMCRHQIEHVECISPIDIPRFNQLGVIASMQPEHISAGLSKFSENHYPKLLGADREQYCWAIHTLKNAGTILAGGSDSPVAKGNPFEAFYMAMERIYDDGNPLGGWIPKEKLKIRDLLDMYTIGPALAEGRENELGTLEPGKLADIVAIDKNLLKESSESIRKAKVILNMTDGKIVYSLNDLDKNH